MLAFPGRSYLGFIMRWVQSEYALKGLFLGLLLYTSLQGPDWKTTGKLALYMLAGLAGAIVIGLLRQLKDLARILKKPHAFLVFLLLENPFLIYLGLVGGLGFGAVELFDPATKPAEGETAVPKPPLIALSVIGAILGYAFSELRTVKDIRYRFGIAIVAGGAIVYAVVMYLEDFSGGSFLYDPDKRKMLGFHILLGLPFYYLLCFVGIAEESEAEIAGLCTMLGLSIYLLKFPDRMPAAGFLLPVAIYFTYVTYVLNGLRVFKHTLRGFIYMEVGKMRKAILAFRRALHLEPNNALAQQGMDWLHANIEIEKVDAGTLALLDPTRCLKRVRQLLGQKPSADEMKKAQHILDLVEKLWPKLTSHVQYHRAVAAIHAGQLEKASEMLADLLNPEGWFPDDAARKTILFDAWQLVLLAHPGLKQRVGEPQLALPGRRMEAIGAVERQLAIQPKEPNIVEFRKTLYAGLQEIEYFDAAKERPPADFGHRYAEEIGMSMINDPERWQRGAQYLRMAANGLPLRRPSIFSRLAEAYAKAGETIQATRFLQYVRDCGLEVGLPSLPDDQRAIYFTTVKRLGDEAAARGEYDEAIYNYSLSTHSPESGVPTLRALAEIYEKKLDIMNALRITEKALCHDGRDPDLLEKKDRYYFSLEVDALAKTAKDDDNVRKYFDVGYCVKKAKSVLDAKNTDLETLDWVHHLVSLALVMQPKSITALVQKARLQLRKGERTGALTILEDVKEMKPEGNDETEAWFYVHKQLGKIYLDELNRADLAIPCFTEYLNHMGSGAETLFDLAKAYEAVGDKAKAIQNYNQVTAYETHPLRWDAEQAIRRLKGG
ncbi:MAG: hypothetical protein K8T89_10650 [Planctomycetes bacterium]|nr:hypothetical protein [Planctomycetota bacterium]